jgi:hypothetical protein
MEGVGREGGSSVVVGSMVVGSLGSGSSLYDGRLTMWFRVSWHNMYWGRCYIILNVLLLLE